MDTGRYVPTRCGLGGHGIRTDLKSFFLGGVAGVGIFAASIERPKAKVVQL